MKGGSFAAEYRNCLFPIPDGIENVKKAQNIRRLCGKTADNVKKIFFCIGIVLLVGCGFDRNKLTGEWRAGALYENGQKMTAPLDSFLLRFDSSGAYRFRTMGRYAESGHFSNSMQYLFLTDTTRTPHREHALKVLFLSKDTLKLQMKRGGKDQVLFLIR
jgi:hypothetical protein